MARLGGITHTALKRPHSHKHQEAQQRMLKTHTKTWRSQGLGGWNKENLKTRVQESGNVHDALKINIRTKNHVWESVDLYGKTETSIRIWKVANVIIWKQTNNFKHPKTVCLANKSRNWSFRRTVKVMLLNYIQTQILLMFYPLWIEFLWLLPLKTCRLLTGFYFHQRPSLRHVFGKSVERERVFKDQHRNGEAQSTKTPERNGEGYGTWGYGTSYRYDDRYWECIIEQRTFYFGSSIIFASLIAYRYVLFYRFR
jgi:hypothetical protein